MYRCLSHPPGPDILFRTQPSRLAYPAVLTIHHHHLTDRSMLSPLTPPTARNSSPPTSPTSLIRSRHPAAWTETVRDADMHVSLHTVHLRYTPDCPRCMRCLLFRLQTCRASLFLGICIQASRARMRGRTKYRGSRCLFSSVAVSSM